MIGTDGRLALPLLLRPQPLDGPAPDVLVTFEDEYFVEWQVADIAPLAHAGGPLGEPL